MLTAELRAVIGIWSEYFINRSNKVLKFRINNYLIKVWAGRNSYIFYVEDANIYISAHGHDVVKYCRMVHKMIEGLN